MTKGSFPNTDLLFFQQEWSRAVGLAATWQVSRSVHDPEIRSEGLFKAPAKGSQPVWQLPTNHELTARQVNFWMQDRNQKCVRRRMIMLFA